VGAGGNGAVYQATHLQLNRPCAIKLQRLDRNGLDPNGRMRLRREALVACQLDHPNVVRIYDFGTNVVTIRRQNRTRTEDELFIAMELLQGRTLEWYLKRNRLLRAEDAVLIARQIAAGLAELHAQGVIHRDLKPANVMLTVDRHGELVVKIIDLGAVKLVDPLALPDDINLTGTLFIGSSLYASPEMCRADPLDTRSDLYSLGLIVYEMLAGHRAFDFSLFPILLYKHAFEEPQPLTGIPEQLLQLVVDAMKKNPDHRLQSAAEFIDRCAEFEQLSGLDCRNSSGLVNALRDSGCKPTVVTVSASDDEETRVAARLVVGTVLSLDAAGIRVDLENGVKAIVAWEDLQPGAGEKFVSPVKPGQRIQAAVKHGGNGNGLMHLSSPVALSPPTPPQQQPKPKKEYVAPPKKAAPARSNKLAIKLATQERARVAIAVIFLVAFAVLSMIAVAGWAMRSRPTTNNQTPVVNTAPPAESYVPQIGDEAETTTDVNIREKHSARSRKVGLAEKGSRVRVLEAHRNWRRILVLQHGREKEDEGSEDEGWIDADNLKRVDGSQR
jgi:serine/threonine protein kinase